MCECGSRWWLRVESGVRKDEASAIYLAWQQSWGKTGQSVPWLRGRCDIIKLSRRGCDQRAVGYLCGHWRHVSIPGENVFSDARSGCKPWSQKKHCLKPVVKGSVDVFKILTRTTDNSLYRTNIRTTHTRTPFPKTKRVNTSWKRTLTPCHSFASREHLAFIQG